MRRKKDRPAQFLACFEGWCQHFLAPPVELYDEAGVNPSREDRCLIRATPEWLQWIEANSQGPFRCLQPWDHGIIRHRPFTRARRTAVEGWKGERFFAAIQIIRHDPQLGVEKPILPEALEVDFDVIGAASGSAGLGGHALEWFIQRLPRFLRRPKKRTNPYRIARMLRWRGIKVERV